ncbi:MAG: aldo/keto reductase [Promethearchaeota archaeon]
MRKVELSKTGEMIPILGQGTWGIKSTGSSDYYNKWKASLRRGIELGITHIDTAEAYGRGVSEKTVGEIIAENKRDDLFITSKLFPMHLRHKTMKKAAYKSLKKLDIDHFDLYLIHWPNPIIPIKKQMKVMDELFSEGKTRYVGVSNFSVDQFKKAQSFLKKTELVTNQLHVNLTWKHQKHIKESLPFYQKEGITITAYSPLAHRGYTNLKGRLRTNLDKLAKNHSATIQQIAIAWLINHERVITIPKAFQVKHVESNAEAADINLSEEEIKMLYDK